MKVVVVGSNPSHSPGGPTLKNLNKWLIQMNAPIISFCNVAEFHTENNRPLKRSEYNLESLSEYVVGGDKVIALGNTASNALKLLKVEHFKLPHPSPRNRQLNDLQFVNCKLEECRIYLEVNNEQKTEEGIQTVPERTDKEVIGTY